MGKLDTIKMAVSRGFGKATLTLKKYSPTILTVAGIASLVGSGVLACRSTLKADAVIEAHKDRLSTVHQARELGMTGESYAEGHPYSEQDYRKDLVTAYSKTAFDFIKLYGPSLLLAVAGITAILSGHNILRKRNLALTAAYAAVDKAFKEYRTRVREELGDDADFRFRTGAKKVKMTEVTTDENGKVVKEKTDAYVLGDEKNPYVPSMYARFFDEYNPYWVKDSQLNLYQLKTFQNECNDRLHSRGYIMLNEVYDKLGFDPTPEGALVGWLSHGDGDGFVDFGIFNVRNEGARLFVNGNEKSILLDFNVDGPIYNKLNTVHTMFG